MSILLKFNSTNVLHQSNMFLCERFLRRINIKMSGANGNVYQKYFKIFSILKHKQIIKRKVRLRPNRKRNK